MDDAQLNDQPNDQPNDHEPLLARLARQWAPVADQERQREKTPDEMTPEELLAEAARLRALAEQYEARERGGGRWQRWWAEQYEARARETPEQRARREAEAEANRAATEAMLRSGWGPGGRLPRSTPAPSGPMEDRPCFLDPTEGLGW